MLALRDRVVDDFEIVLDHGDRRRVELRAALSDDRAKPRDLGVVRLFCRRTVGDECCAVGALVPGESPRRCRDSA